MAIRIDIARINNHISYLEAEIREAYQLADTFQNWIQDNTDPDATAVLSRQLQRINHEIQCIQGRIKLLQTITDEFLQAKNDISESLNHAKYLSDSPFDL